MKVTSDQIIVGFIKGRPELAKELLVRSGVGFDKNISDSELLESVVSAYTYSPKFRKEFQQVFQGVIEESYQNFAGGEYNRAFQIQSGSSGFNDMNWDLKNFSGEFSSDKGEFSDFAGEFANAIGDDFGSGLGFPKRSSSFLSTTPSLSTEKKVTPSILTTMGSGSQKEGGKGAGVIAWLKNTFSNEEGKLDTEKANQVLNTGFGILNSIRGKGGQLTDKYESDQSGDTFQEQGWWKSAPTWQKVAVIGVPVIIVGLIAWKFSKAKK